MSPMWGNLIGVATVLTMAVFIGIWIWAWRKRHKKVFDRMAALPMEDELGAPAQENDKRGTQDE
ncbi:cytochrome c oxidase subunit [gamma proteobacterium HdN1]|nr:cytochrome c oxidase subunit [gamma proteobacterium HdN1]